MSWYQTYDGIGSIGVEIQLIEVHRVLPIDAGVLGPERDLSRPGIDQPLMFVVGLIGQRIRDLIDVQLAEVEHGNQRRKVLRTGRLHQQSSAQPHSTAPMPSTNRPMTAKSR